MCALPAFSHVYVASNPMCLVASYACVATHFFLVILPVVRHFVVMHFNPFLFAAWWNISRPLFFNLKSCDLNTFSATLL